MILSRNKFYSREGLLFFLLLGLVLVSRIIVLFHFSFRYTDSDQAIMWEGMKDFSHGEFHEPRFYGQSYNSMLEALLAVPANFAGVPPYYALPVVTSILALFPYFLVAFIVFRKKSPAVSMIILSIPLVLPVEYSLITSLPRGFVTGIFISSFSFIALFSAGNKWKFFFAFFFAALGFSINPNAFLFIAPCLAFLFVENRKNRAFYFYGIAGLLPALLLHFAAAYFYKIHPGNDIHSFPLEYSFKAIFAGLSRPGLFFDDVSPLFPAGGFLLLIFFFATGAWMIRKKEKLKGLITLTIPFLILLTLGINKVHDGTESVFFSYSRMYLALPLTLALFLSILPVKNIPRYFYFFLLVPVFYFTYETVTLDKKININTDPQRFHMVAVAPLDTILSEYKRVNKICADHHVDLLVIAGHDYGNFYAYGFPALDDNFPKTLFPAFERRTWRLEEDVQKIYSTVLVADTTGKFSENPLVKPLQEDSSFYIVNDNKMPAIELLDKLGIWIRNFR